MEFAVVGGRRCAPGPNGRGSCPACGSPTIGKCGPKRIWHWAHAGRRHCDPWWENETEWHRQWKACFPEDQREVVHFDATGEKHVADVKTARGMVIEFQNSPMSPVELRAREDFYGRMFWVVNGAPFVERFHIMSALPDPKAPFAQDLVFYEQRSDWFGRLFWRRSENPDYRGTGDLVRVHSVSEIEDEIARHHTGHFLFDWKRARDVWYSASAPVFIDLGGPVLWRLGVYDDRGLRCVRRTLKSDLVLKNGGTYENARAQAEGGDDAV